jgi:hypothetical protein
MIIYANHCSGERSQNCENCLHGNPTGTVHEDVFKRNVSDKRFRGKTYFVLKNFFFLETRAVHEIMWGKCGGAREAADNSVI